jgi:septum formation topological specificity factor MinE
MNDELRRTLRKVQRATARVDAVHAKEPELGASVAVLVAHERKADAAIHAESAARRELAAVLRRLIGSVEKDVAVNVDGTLVILATSLDGLMIMPADQVIDASACALCESYAREQN